MTVQKASIDVERIRVRLDKLSEVAKGRLDWKVKYWLQHNGVGLYADYEQRMIQFISEHGRGGKVFFTGKLKESILNYVDEAEAIIIHFPDDVILGIAKDIIKLENIRHDVRRFIREKVKVDVEQV